MKRYIIQAGGILALSLQAPMAVAQTDSTMNRSLTIQREFAPEATKAVKIDRQPAIEEIKTRRSVATFAEAETKASTARALATIPAQQVIASQDPYQLGYVDFNIGNYWNTNLNAGLRLGEFTLKANGYYTYSNKLQWNKSSIAIFDFDRNTMNSLVPGSKTTTSGVDLSDAYWDHSRLLKGDLVAAYDHTFYNDARLHAHIGARGQSANLLWGGDVKMKFLNIYTNVSYSAEDWTIGLNYDRTAVNYIDLVDNNFSLSGEYYFTDAENWRATAGLKLGGTWTDDEFHFSFLPKVEFSYLPDPDYIRRIFVKIEGGTDRTALASLLESMPLVVPRSVYDNQGVLGATIGWEDNENGWFKWNVWASVQQLWNEVTGVMMINPDSEIALGTYSPYKGLGASDVIKQMGRNPGPYMELENFDCLDISGGINIDYEYNRYFSAKASAGFSYDTGVLADPTNPGINASLHFVSRPISQLTLDLGYDGQYNRKGTMSFSYNDPSDKRYRFNYNLKEIHDLNLRADYQLLQNLDVYAQAKNLLNREYDSWVGVPSQKINFLIGAKWRF